jgi:hypothetical protein
VLSYGPSRAGPGSPLEDEAVEQGDEADER